MIFYKSLAIALAIVVTFLTLAYSLRIEDSTLIERKKCESAVSSALNDLRKVIESIDNIIIDPKTYTDPITYERLKQIPLTVIEKQRQTIEILAGARKTCCPEEFIRMFRGPGVDAIISKMDELSDNMQKITTNLNATIEEIEDVISAPIYITWALSYEFASIGSFCYLGVGFGPLNDTLNELDDTFNELKDSFVKDAFSNLKYFVNKLKALLDYLNITA